MVFNTTLRELPGILTKAARPKHLPQWVGHYDTHVRPVPIIINHLLHLPPVPDDFIVSESRQFSNGVTAKGSESRVRVKISFDSMIHFTLTLDSDPNLTLYSDPINW